MKSSIEKVTKQNDRFIDSDWLTNRQHHQNGQSEIEDLINQLFGDPNLNDQSEVAFEKYIYLSQIYQAVCTSSQAEYYRSRAGVGGTMGALYWQLNEIWPTGGWGVIEYGRESEDGSQIIGGRWKVRISFVNYQLETYLNVI